jgi:hypothetical protein
MTPGDLVVETAQRQDLTRRFLREIDALLSCQAPTARATQLALLKRELARAHASLLAANSERNYLAIVTLAEGVLAATYWRELNESSINLLRNALAVGLEDRPIEYEDYVAQLRCLHANGVHAAPTFELSDEPGCARGPGESAEGNDEPANPKSPVDPIC